MIIFLQFTIVAVICLCSADGFSETDNFPKVTDGTELLSRRKRFVAFPEGASIAFALDMTHGLFTPDPFWTEGISWAVAYDLPNSTFFRFGRFRNRHYLQRRSRRDIYNRMEIVMNSLGFSGRECIYRAICETAKEFFPGGKSVAEDLLKILFKFPDEKVSPSEPEDHQLYHYAYKMGQLKEEECSQLYSECPFSILDLLLGGYSPEKENTQM